MTKPVSSDEHLAVEPSIEAFFREFFAWLKGPIAADDRVLVDWLQGFGGMPAEHLGGTPSDWLYRAAQRARPVGSVGERALRVVARRLALVLDRQPDAKPLGDLPAELLTNLFYLAAKCRDRVVLWEPLLEVWHRHERQPGPLMQKPEVRTAFRAALTANQAGTELTRFWLKLVRSEPVAALGGGWLEGLRGVCLQPLEDGVSLPSDLGNAIRVLVDSRRGDLRAGREDLASAFELVASILHRNEFLDLALANLVNQAGWPRWAVESLPSLVIDLHESQGRYQYFLMLDAAARCLRAYFPDRVDLRDEKNPRGGVLWRIGLATDLLPALPAQVRAVVEYLRRTHRKYPFSDEKSLEQGIEQQLGLSLQLPHPYELRAELASDSRVTVWGSPEIPSCRNEQSDDLNESIEGSKVGSTGIADAFQCPTTLFSQSTTFFESADLATNLTPSPKSPFRSSSSSIE